MAGHAFLALGGSFANSMVGTVGFSALAGGVGAELSGGDFWRGAATGATVGLLNAGGHALEQKWNQIKTGVTYGWGWRSEVTKQILNDAQARKYIQDFEDQFSNLSEKVSWGSYAAGTALAFASKINPWVGVGLGTYSQAVSWMAGSISDAANNLKFAYEQLSNQNGLRIVTTTDMVVNQGMSVSSSTTNFYLQNGAPFFTIRH